MDETSEAEIAHLKAYARARFEGFFEEDDRTLAVIVDKFADELARYADELSDRLFIPNAKCESPIERLMLAHLIYDDSSGYGGPSEHETFWDYPMDAYFSSHLARATMKCAVADYANAPQPEKDQIILHRLSRERGNMAFDTQVVVADYRVDIAVYVIGPDKTLLKIAVECDGHSFHEKTKEQASRDKKRDRELQKHGWLVFRFSGSDIWNNGRACSAEIHEFIGKWIEGPGEKPRFALDRPDDE